MDNIDFDPNDKAQVLALGIVIVLGATVFVCALWVVVGLVVSAPFALYLHSLTPLGWGAGVGAGIGLLISIFKAFVGYIRGSAR